METTELQQQLFSHLRENLPPHLSMVDELCELLELSPDSVYRRIRGEKPITLNELKRICSHYHLSIDHLLQLDKNLLSNVKTIRKWKFFQAEFLVGQPWMVVYGLAPKKGFECGHFREQVKIPERNILA